MNDLIEDFLFESEEGISAIEGYLIALEKNPNDESAIWQTMRILHTIKGTCGFMGFDKLMQVSHFGEEILVEAKDGKKPLDKDKIDLLFEVTKAIRNILSHIKQFKTEPEGDILSQLKSKTTSISQETSEMPEPINDEFIKIKAELLDDMMYSIDELILAQNNLSSKQMDSDGSNWQHMSKLANMLQMHIASARMQPLENLFHTYPKVVRNLAKQLGKEVEFEIEGAEITVDKGILQLIKDPITHLLRNAIDHGIELPEDRAQAGKNAKGKVKIIAKTVANRISIIIHDDGSGLNIKRIKEKIIEKNLLTLKELEVLSEDDIYQYIFTKGFSTAQSVSDISGRGVGLDIVKGSIEKAGGSLKVVSMQDIGTNFIIDLPSSINITDALILKSNDNAILLPLQSAVKIIDPSIQEMAQFEFVNNSWVYKMGEAILPITKLNYLLNQQAPTQALPSTPPTNVVILKVNDRICAISVDQILDIEEVVIRPNPSIFHDMKIFSGSTILNSTEIALMLDPIEIMEKIGIDNTLPSDTLVKSYTASNAQNNEFVIFTTLTGAKTLNALPIEQVKHLICLPSSSIQNISDHLIAHNAGKALKIINIEKEFARAKSNEVNILVCTCNSEDIGIIVDTVLEVRNHDRSLPNITLGETQVSFVDSEAIKMINLENYLASNISDSTNLPLVLSPLNQRHVVLIDDSPFFRKFIPPLLMKAGYKVSIVEDVQNAIKIIKNNHDISAIITDSKTTGLDELKFLDAIRSHSHDHNIPVIALSSIKSNIEEQKLKPINIFDALVPKLQHARLLKTLNELAV